MPMVKLLPNHLENPVALVRTEPVQGRSAARVEVLLDAAAVIVDKVGFDRMTTGMVAEQAGASIGTVYRYFVDRIVLLQALCDRATRRYRQAVIDSLHEAEPQHWSEAVDCALDAFAQMFRTEPGFRIIRFTDAERGGAGDEHGADFFQKRFAETLVQEYGLPAGSGLKFHLNIALQMADALVYSAFVSEPNGDQEILAEAHRIVRLYLGSYYGEEEIEGPAGGRRRSEQRLTAIG